MLFRSVSGSDTRRQLLAYTQPGKAGRCWRRRTGVKKCFMVLPLKVNAALKQAQPNVRPVPKARANVVLHCATRFSVWERASGSGSQPRSGCRCSLVSKQRQGNLRVSLPRMCRSSTPADYCHSNCYPLRICALDENVESLLPAFRRVNRRKACVL